MLFVNAKTLKWFVSDDRLNVLVQPVVKVRGNAVPGSLKIAGERSQAPYSR